MNKKREIYTSVIFGTFCCASKKHMYFDIFFFSSPFPHFLLDYFLYRFCFDMVELVMNVLIFFKIVRKQYQVLFFQIYFLKSLKCWQTEFYSPMIFFKKSLHPCYLEVELLMNYHIFHLHVICFNALVYYMLSSQKLHLIWYK